MKQNITYEITTTKVLFFDMDGTLVDTDYANFLCYQKAISSITSIDAKAIFMPDERLSRNNLRDFIPNLTEKEYISIIQEKEKCYGEFLHETKICKEIVDILFKYSSTNKTFLVTNSRKDRAIAILNHYGLTKYFDQVFSQEKISEKNKINKFENAISKLGISPSCIIVFENEESEILLAIKAGIKTINPKVAEYYEKI